MDEIKRIKKSGKFVWGNPIKWHEIGPYTLLEYECKISKKTSFYGWIHGKRTNSSWDSLETGLIGLFVRKSLGMNNDNIAIMVCRGIGIIGNEIESK